MYAVEFVADKVPLFDSVWDVGQTFVRPLIGAWVGYEFAGADGASSVDQALAGRRHRGAGAGQPRGQGEPAARASTPRRSRSPTSSPASARTSRSPGSPRSRCSSPSSPRRSPCILLVAGVALVVVRLEAVRRAWALVRERYGQRPCRPHDRLEPPPPAPRSPASSDVTRRTDRQGRGLAAGVPSAATVIHAVVGVACLRRTTVRPPALAEEVPIDRGAPLDHVDAPSRRPGRRALGRGVIAR